MGWNDQVVNLIILTEQTAGFSGLFGYSPTVGAGNLLFSLSASAGTDPYGNSYPQGLNLTMGTISGTTFSGTDFTINSSGAFFYSPTVGAGNLIASVAPAPGADGFGNDYVEGVASYGNLGFASQLITGLLIFYTGSLSGGWTQAGSVSLGPGASLLLSPSGSASVITNNNTLDDGSGNATFSGHLTVNGSSSTGNPSPNSTSTNGVSDGTTHGTSGPASAGTAHTHSAGSYALGSGQHSHDLDNHTHPL